MNLVKMYKKWLSLEWFTTINDVVIYPYKALEHCADRLGLFTA